jgi:hypothetical protein
MSRIQVAGRKVELSGLHGVWLGADHLTNSKITLFYINGRPTQTIEYGCGQHVQAEKDRKSIEDALRPTQCIVPREPSSDKTTSGERLA